MGELLRGYFRDKNMECQQTEYGSGKEFLERAEETDILLLDIDAGEVSGLQLKNMLQGRTLKFCLWQTIWKRCQRLLGGMFMDS